MYTYQKKIPAWVITIIIVVIVALTALLSFLVIGHLSGMIDKFFK